MRYEPSDKTSHMSVHSTAAQYFAGHSEWIKFLADRYKAIRLRSTHVTMVIVHILQYAFRENQIFRYVQLLILFKELMSPSLHPLAREPIFRLVALGLRILQRSPFDSLCELKFRTCIYRVAFKWFSATPQ